MTSLSRFDTKLKKKKGRNWLYIFELIILLGAFFYFSHDFGDSTDSSTAKKKKDNLFAKLELADHTVMQSFAIDETNKNIYVAQAKSSTTQNVAESYVITRCTLDGRMLDKMTLKYGGHGTNIGVEVNSKGVYIWSSYDQVNKKGVSKGHDLVRFKYKAGATYTPSSSDLKRYSKLINTSSSVQVATTIDNANRRLAVRQRQGDKTKIDIYNLDDVLKGDNHKLHTLSISKELYYLQGFSLENNYLYWRTGDTNEERYKDYVSIFNISTGKLMTQIHETVGIDTMKHESNFREPEGVFLYTNPDTGKKSLLVGVVTGASGKRFYRIYKTPVPLN
ncbi:phage baseplate protein [Neobacillus jeddahensis]|uniref:phage baseplate protein n=1 Tax=Neobacillus jeddahensis TaxID=1461580 RepID=UPI000693A70F|nr:hypothetical protein [Neobacillus jeddahensis]